MNQYLDLVKTVLDKGIIRTNRTGVDTIMYFGYHYKVDLQNGFPLLTTKTVRASVTSRTGMPYKGELESFFA